jgi:tetratricopeptide (TPR) repeat protein
MLGDIMSSSAIKGLYTYWPFAATFIGNGYLFVITTTVLTLILIGVCLVVKYTPSMLNDLKTTSNNELPSLALKLWIVLLLAFPVFFDAGPLWFVLWWFFVLWGYLTVMEKRIAYVFISLIFMSSWIAHVGAGFLTYSQTNVNKEIFSIDQNIGSPADGLAVSAWIRNNQADAEPMNTQAIIEIQRKNNQAAMSLLSRSLDLKPDNSRYYNHLGIALAGIGKNNEAIKAFQNAATIDPENVIYHYNLSRIYQANYSFSEAEHSIQKASSIDSEEVRTLLDKEARSKGKKYIFEHVPVMEQISRQMMPSENLSKTADSLWHLAFGIFGRNRVFYIGIGAILIIFLLGHIPEEKFTKRCNRCGNLYYAGTTSKSGYPMCLQCHWIETKPKKQMNSILTNKAEEIREYRATSSSHAWKLEFILPGMGSFIVNKHAKALLRLTVFCACLILIITGCHFLYSFVPSGIEYTGLIRITGIILLGLLYWRAYKSPPLKYGV